MNDLQVQVSEQLKEVDASKAAQIKAAFTPMVEMLESFEEAYNQVVALEMTPGKCAVAKRLRLDISRVRIDADKVRIAQKAEYIRGGKAIQGFYNILEFAVKDKEGKLSNIEQHYELIEAEKKAKLQEERRLELSKYEADGGLISLGDMPEEVWGNYLSGVILNYKAVKKAEEKAEKDRVKSEKKAKLYQDRREALLPYSDFVDISLLDIEDNGKEYQAFFEKARTLKSAYEAEQEEIRLEGKKQKAKNEKLEREIAAKEKVDRDIAEKIAERNRKLAESTDKERLFSIAVKLRNTKTTVKSQEAIQALEDVALYLENKAKEM